VDIAEMGNGGCQGFPQDWHGGGYTGYIVVKGLENCWVVDSDALQLGDWLHHVDVLHRLDGSAHYHAAGRHAFTRGFSVGWCGGCGQDACPDQACIAYGKWAGTLAAKTNLRDTAACSQQLDETLLVRLVHLGTQSADRGNDIGASASVRY
jgi:hypothetical protein